MQQPLDGTAALETAALQQPSVVVTDIRMPGPISALDVCRHFHTHAVPDIIMTGLTAHDPDVQEVLQAASDR